MQKLLKSEFFFDNICGDVYVYMYRAPVFLHLRWRAGLLSIRLNTHRSEFIAIETVCLNVYVSSKFKNRFSL